MNLQFLLVHVHGGTILEFVSLFSQLHVSKWGA
jgi:hypothetical protein